MALLHAAPVQGVSRPPHTASRDCRTAHPLPVRSRVRLHRKTGARISARAPKRSAASRDGMAGWAGEGGGRFGERREYEAPTLPSTPRQHGMARHYTRQAINNTSPQQPGQKRHATSARCGSPLQKPAKKQHAKAARRGSPPHMPAEKQLTTTNIRQETTRHNSTARLTTTHPSAVSKKPSGLQKHIPIWRKAGVQRQQRTAQGAGIRTQRAGLNARRAEQALPVVA